MTRTAAWIVALGLVLVSAVACGKSEDQKRAEEAAKQAERAAKQVEEAGKKIAEAGKQASDGSAEMAKGLDAMAKGLGALAGGTGDNKAVEPVSFRELQTVFVDFPGWERAKPTGEKATMPISLSKAEVTYRKGDARIDVDVVDSGFNQLLLFPLMWVHNTGYEKETERGYEKAIKVAGHPGFEKWDTERRSGEVSAFVNKRFIVDIKGRQIDDVKVLHALAVATDLGKLASLK